jgi:AcrR family transcriptional regulator
LSLREQKKKQTRAALLAEAHRLFTERGYDDATVEEICERAGVSKRTFFRYFPSKEDLVFPNHEERLARFLTFLASADHAMPAFDTLRLATRVFAADYMENREHFIAQQRLIETSPGLMAREHQIDLAWEQVMAAWFGRKLGLGTEEPELAAKVLAGAAIGVIRATMRHWTSRNGADDLEALGISAIAKLERGFTHVYPID